MNRNQQEFYRQALVSKLNELGPKVKERMTEGIKDFEDPEADIYDLCVQLYSKEQLFSLCERDRQVLTAIRAALEKLTDNRYGTCEECEQPINAKRLQALPWVRLCIRCQSRQEENRAA